MSVFVDTSAFFALLVREEPAHEATATAFRQLVEDDRPLVTTNYVLIETAALLQSRLGLDPVRDLEDSLVPLLEIVWMTPALHRRSVERHHEVARRRVSLVDCSSFVVMEDRELREALALDQDFSDQGFLLIPERP